MVTSATKSPIITLTEDQTLVQKLKDLLEKSQAMVDPWKPPEQVPYPMHWSAITRRLFNEGCVATWDVAQELCSQGIYDTEVFGQVCERLDRFFKTGDVTYLTGASGKNHLVGY